MRSKLTTLSTSLIVPLALVTVWWFVSAQSTSPYFPALATILEGFRDTWTSERLATDLLPSIIAVATGFVIAVVVGVLVGVAVGLSPRVRRDLQPVLEFLRATPVVALIPIALIVLGPGLRMEMALVAFAGTWPILVSAADGVRSADQIAIDTARVYGLSARRRLFQVIIPGAMPQVMAGVRIAVAAAVGTMIVANMLASSAGLGHLVINAQQSFNILETWAGLLMIGLVGCLMTGLVVLAERALLGWHRQWRAVGQAGDS